MIRCSAAKSSLRYEQIPKYLDVSVVMQAQNSINPWADVAWSALAVVVANKLADTYTKPHEILHHQDQRQILYPGFRLSLYKDECESYYHNLMSPNPGCYIVAVREGRQARPVPFMVSLSFDEAHAYLEGDADIFTVPIPPELYRWTEQFVLENHCPEKRKKRKNNKWRPERGGS